MLELATLIRQMTGSRSEIIHEPLPKDDPVRRNPDITRAKKLLGGWGPKVPLEEGIAATIAYFRSVVVTS
jgi:UDP-glucuronate decarboxylase